MLGDEVACYFNHVEIKVQVSRHENDSFEQKSDKAGARFDKYRL